MGNSLNKERGGDGGAGGQSNGNGENGDNGSKNWTNGTPNNYEGHTGGIGGAGFSSTGINMSNSYLYNDSNISPSSNGFFVLRIDSDI